MPATPEPPAREIYSISRLNREARALLERGLGALWVEGEISNFARPSSGHWYFSLKDREAQVRCAMFRQRNMLAGFTPQEGQAVVARARVSLYEPRGDYQLLVEHIEEAGLGALKRAFDALKAKLAAEGLFDGERKRPLPVAPRRIGVITSPTGAALRDILHILARRFPVTEVIVYAVPVQGAAAAPAIVAALELAASRAECEVLILARGGGSLEDLWAFNDEALARAIHRCPIPLVSGVGHEIDFTIADFVADVRAPTPSAAAELVVPDRREWLERLRLFGQRLGSAQRRRVQQAQLTFDHLAHRLRRLHPEAQLQRQAQTLDGLEQRLQQSALRVWQTRRDSLGRLQLRLAAESPQRRLSERQLRQEALGLRLHHAWRSRLEGAATRLEVLARALQGVSPLATLGRGFSILTRASDGTLLTDARQIDVGAEIEARLARGALRARVLGRTET